MKNRMIRKIVAITMLIAQITTSISMPVVAEDSVSGNEIVQEIEQEEVVEEIVEEIPQEEIIEVVEEIPQEVIEDVVEETPQEVIEEVKNEVVEESEEEQGSELEEIKESEVEIVTYVLKVVSSVDGSVLYEGSIEENADYDLAQIEVSEVEGYTFDGFYIVEEKVESVSMSEDLEVVAKYVEIEVEETEVEETEEVEFNVTENGLSLAAEVGVVPANTTVVAETVEDTNEVYEILLEELNNDLDLVDENTFAEVTNLKVYDITLENEGVEVQPNGNVEITVDFETKEDRQYFAYYVNGSEVERLACEVVESGIKFETNHFSVYAVAEVELMATLAEGEATTFADTCTYAGNEDLFTQVDTNSAGTYYYLDNNGVLWLYSDGTPFSSSNQSFKDLVITDVLAVKYTTDCNNINLTSGSNLFSEFKNCESIDLSKFITNDCKSMARMFYECNALTTLDLSGFETSNVTTMAYMFFNCSSLTTLNISGFDTSNVTNMSSMFDRCVELTTLDVAGFDTGKVKNMSSMFYGCRALTTLDVAGFDTSNVITMGSMFSGCQSLTSIDISDFVTSNVTTMGSMFSGCQSLTTLELPTISVASRRDFISGDIWCNSNDYTTNVRNTLNGTDTIPAGTYEKCYAVTYNTNNGGSDIVEYAKANSLLSEKVLIREGYEFGGWYKDSALTSAWNHDTDTVTAYTKLYAKWSKDVYIVSFDTNGGLAVEDQTVAFQDKVIEPTEPTKDHYVFKGWFTDNTYATKWVFDTDIVTSNITLYAKWLPAYTVSFANTGDSTVPNQTIGQNGLVSLPTEPTKAYYEFAGWFTDMEYTTEWNFATDKVTEDITLYAKWNPGKCIVYFSGGSYADRIVETQNVTINELATNPGSLISTNDEYVFVGWFNGNVKWDFENDIVTHDISLDAKWVHKSTTYTVKFEPLDPFGLNWFSIPDQVVNVGECATKPETPSKSQEFWFCSDEYYDGINRIHLFDFENTPIYYDMTLYYSAVGGQQIKYHNINNTTLDYEEIDSFYVKPNTVLERPTDPTCSIGEFVGWFDTEPTGIDVFNPVNAFHFWDFSEPVTHPIHFYAIYALKYNVTFDSDGGTNVVTQSVYENGLVEEPIAPTKEHYVFKGWFDETLETEWDFANDKVTEHVVLYAKWEDAEGYRDGERIECEVVFNTQGGSSVNSQTVYYFDNAIKPENPSKEGYEFVNWYKDSTCEELYDFNEQVKSDITLYAKWEKEVYTVNFDCNDGSAVADQNVAFQDKVVEPTAPTKAKAEFVGWYSDSALTIPYDFDTKVESAMTLYAKWVNTYEVSFNVDGGSVVETQIVRENEKAIRPTDPEKATYYFVGWFVDSTLTVEYDFDTTVTSDMTIYAKWEGKLEHQKGIEQETPIEFAWNDTVEDAQDAIKDSEDSAYDKTNNYWTAKMNVAPVNVETLENTFSELQSAAETYEYAMAFDISVTKYISTDADLTDVIDSKNVTETKKPLVISFNAPELPTKKAIDKYSFFRVHDGVLEELPLEFDRVNNVFTFESDKFSEFAMYYEIKDVFTVTFDSNGGSEVGSQDVIDGHKVNEPSNPTREGFEFMGWFVDTALTDTFDFNEAITGDITVIAKWKKNVTEQEPAPTPTPGKEEPKEEEPSSDEEPEEPQIELPTPILPQPILPQPELPIRIKTEEDHEEHSVYIPTTINPVEEEIVVANGVTYVRTTEYGALVNKKELRNFDLSLFTK